MENEKNVEALCETNEEVVIEETDKVGVIDRITGSKPIRVVKKHWKGFVAGVATAAAIGTAAVMAGKAAADGAIETPLNLDEVKDAVDGAIEG